MASTDLKSFIQTRLLAFDPTMDLDPGSPAQTQIVDPIISYLGTDPFETDIDKFIVDRFAQEFPDLYAGDPGALRDVFINPLRLLLEPFKRETATIRRNQSLIDPTVLSDADADALVANVFDTRDTGGTASGVGRAYFANPTDLQMNLGTRWYTSGGLSFFPVNPVSITAEEMVFNREGSLFYFDVALQANAEGSEFNVLDGELIGVEGLSNTVRVTNLQKFTGGATKQDTPTFVATAEAALTERSLVTRRGARARLSTVFKGAVRAIQVIGAKDAEMQRDILMAASPGHAWATGRVMLYKNLAYVRVRTIDGDPNKDLPAPGDTLYIYLRAPIENGTRFVRLTVEELLFGPMEDGTDPVTHNVYERSYMVRWSDTGYFHAGFATPDEYEGGFAKKGVLKVSSLPTASTVDLTVNNGEVHVYGRSDIYVRPVEQDSSTVVLDGLYDLGKLGHSDWAPYFFLEKEGLVTHANLSVVEAGGSYDYGQQGVEAGDVLYIEQGADAGPHVIAFVGTNSLVLTSPLKENSPTRGYRYRVVKTIRINPFEPRIMRFPFGSRSNADMSTAIGSAMVRLATTDIIDFGAVVGDYLRILSGPDAGTYIIQSFDSQLGGQAPVLDQPMTSTSGNISYEVFAPLTPVEKPLVRIKEVMLLDSSKQSTSLTVPPADPVAVMPTGPFSSARTISSSQLASGYVLPDLAGLTTGLANRPAVIQQPAGGDDRYSRGIDTPVGIYLAQEFDQTGVRVELDIRTNAAGTTGDTAGVCSYFIATVESMDEAENFPPIDPKPGEVLTLKSGPNKGGYLIKQVQKFKYKQNREDNSVATNWVYFIQIYGAFPVDPLKEVINFLGGAAAAGLSPLPNPTPFPNFYADWYAALGDKVRVKLQAMSTTPGAAAISTAIEAMAACAYECGTPSRGVLRTYFKEPTLFETGTALSLAPVTYSFKAGSGDSILFRPDPMDFDKYELLPPRVTGDADPTAYYRDLTFVGNDLLFTDNTRPTFPEAGIRTADVVSIHEEVFIYDEDTTKQTIIQTVDGSAQITAPLAAGPVFKPNMAGCLMYLEEGADKGGYRITKVIDEYNLLLDKVMTVSSPVIAKSGTNAVYGADDGGTRNRIAAVSGTPFSVGDRGNFITPFDMDYRWMGSFEILDVLGNDGFGHYSSVVIKPPTSDNFPAFQVPGTIRWVITAAPTQTPTPIVRDPGLTNTTGTELCAGVPVRIYDLVPHDYEITDAHASVPGHILSVAGTPKAGTAQPYRIYRRNIRRVTPSEMDANREGPFVYFDTDVVSLSSSPSANLAAESYLTVDRASYKSLGYRHVVADSSYSYSLREEGFLDLPTKVLPIGNADAPENYLSLIGAPVQISYEKAPLVTQFQEFVDSVQDRVLSSDQLVRHFLPSYVSYDVEYVGGAAPADIAKDIITFIDSTEVEVALDVSELEKIVIQRGGNPITPTKVSITIYDWDRNVWAEFSSNELGGAETKVPYNGSPRVSFVIPGPDVSGLDPIPTGERIRLVRL
jgi:hypothetical protein